MKKVVLVIIMLICVIGSVFINLKYNEDNKESNEEKKDKTEDVDYSSIPFVDIDWTRSTEADTEYISFSSNGGFSYYCSCGNPVNDSDLCDKYTYDEESKTITLTCIEEVDSTITEIEVISYDDSSLVLDFDGEERIFEMEA